ncbi:MAG: ribonuclease HII [candidate division Zixibacteria bacterium]|nr:ribonuclease HII [candidate division Zixibacteria bacterium]
MDSKLELFAGIDDATKCPCIGSIFIAGVVADERLLKLWKDKGVKDSKLLSRKKRDELDRLIRQSAPETTIRHIPPHEIDDKSLNLNSWEMVAFLKLLRNLYRKQPFAKAIVDNWEVSAELFFKRLELLTGKDMIPLLLEKGISIPKRLHRSIKIYPEHQADENHVVVGAASILARAASDRQYDRYRKTYGDFGSGSPGDPKTRMYVWNNRHNPTPIIRQSWNTFKTLSRLESIEDDYWYRKKNGVRKRQPRPKC